MGINLKNWRHLFKNPPKNSIAVVLVSGILIVVISQLLLMFALFYIKTMNRRNANSTRIASPAALDAKSLNLSDLSEEDLAAARAFLKFKKIKESFVPIGVPEVYGQELNVSFDQVQDAINKTRAYGPTYGQEGKKIVLMGADMERYKKIGESIACEYCCGVKTLTKPDGSAACGCAHSIMMRGLSAYLIKNHPEVTDEWILGELSKWKKTYFPKQTLSAELLALEKSGEEGIKEILREFPDFLPQMVGGC